MATSNIKIEFSEESLRALQECTERLRELAAQVDVLRDTMRRSTSASAKAVSRAADTARRSK